jgi:tRNA (adenine37-N6)-methyltransferase
MITDPIGVARTSRSSTADTPVQSNLNPGELGTILVHERYRDALDGLDEFDYMWLLTSLEQRDDPNAKPAGLKQVPYLLQRAPRLLGIFATRGPRRPNSIGLSLVRLVSIVDLTITFAGVDIIDGTPILDIKPWVRAFDQPPEPHTVRCGWFDTVDLDAPVTPRDLRPDTP